MAEVIHPLPFIPVQISKSSPIPYHFHSQAPPQVITKSNKSKKKSMQEPMKATASDRKEKAALQPKRTDGPITVVLNVNLHCEGCAKKVRQSLKYFPGVESLATDVSGNKLTVVGKVDPLKVRERVESKTHRKVMLISPLVSNADNSTAQKKKKEKEKEVVDEKVQARVKAMGEDYYGGEDEEEEYREETMKLKRKGKAKEMGGKVDANAAEGKEMVDKTKPKDDVTQDYVSPTVVLKVGFHCKCEGCKRRLRKRISKFNGVHSVDIDTSEELVLVKGTMDAKALECYLKKKSRHSFDIIHPKKGNDNNRKKKERGGNHKSEEPYKDGDGDNSGDCDGTIEESSDVGKKSGNKIEGGRKKGGRSGGNRKRDGNDNWVSSDVAKLALGTTKVEYYGGLPVPGGYFGGSDEIHACHRMDAAVHAPQFFSDENPNACSVM